MVKTTPSVFFTENPSLAHELRAKSGMGCIKCSLCRTKCRDGLRTFLTNHFHLDLLHNLKITIGNVLYSPQRAQRTPRKVAKSSLRSLCPRWWKKTPTILRRLCNKPISTIQIGGNWNRRRWNKQQHCRLSLVNCYLFLILLNFSTFYDFAKSNLMFNIKFHSSFAIRNS